MHKIVLVFFITLFLFSCVATYDKVRVNKFMDPDTGIETIESIISFNEGDDQTFISFNQTKNPRNISWYIICKFCSTVDNEFSTADLTIDKKSNIFEIGHSSNKYDLKTANSNIFRQVDYFKINETVIADLNNCENLKLRFNCVDDTLEFAFDKEQTDAVKDWIKNITIPK
ncbi:MAG: hypothetical protein KAH33_06610 [Candidatus Delongbacteria bacterium]|nr:hypothetical protein [Candidatus Delongbacteria bacterium]